MLTALSLSFVGTTINVGPIAFHDPHVSNFSAHFGSDEKIIAIGVVLMAAYCAFVLWRHPERLQPEPVEPLVVRFAPPETAKEPQTVRSEAH